MALQVKARIRTIRRNLAARLLKIVRKKTNEKIIGARRLRERKAQVDKQWALTYRYKQTLTNPEKRAIAQENVRRLATKGTSLGRRAFYKKDGARRTRKEARALAELIAGKR
jgi:hypothetical protein